MNCSLGNVISLILLAVFCLLAAIALAYYWPTALPLFAAAALVASVSFVIIPAAKDALFAYAACRGSSTDCAISSSIVVLGQLAAAISFIAFAVAAVLQVAALAALVSWILALFGASLEGVVATLVTAGITACGVGIVLCFGVLTQAYAYKNCMDQQGPNPHPSAL
jgi:hypothetical protein